MGDFSLVRVSLCCSRLYFVLKCFLMKVLCHLSVSPLIGIYNNVKIENILNSNFLLASAEDQTARQSSEITTRYIGPSWYHLSMNDHLVLAKIEHRAMVRRPHSQPSLYIGKWGDGMRHCEGSGRKQKPGERGKRDGVSSITETDNQ